jgi:phosphate transport system substrate-binding protein
LKKLFVVLLSVIMMVIVGGCGSQTTKAPATKDNSIKIGGSSTMAPVIAKCADDFTEKFHTWKKVNDRLPDEPIVIFVATGGSGFGVKSAMNNTVDMGLVSRDVKEAEKAKLTNHTLYTLGYDALTIAVNPQNPVLTVKPDITNDEIKKIFSGEIKTWNQLDPNLPNRPIVLAIRDLGGGASQVFDELIMKGTPIAKEAVQLPSMGALAGKVMDNADAIGYVSVGLVEQNKGKIGVLSVEGIQPTTENIASGKYKIARPLIVIAKATPDDREQQFLNYLQSEKGVKALSSMGFVPVQAK